MKKRFSKKIICVAALLMMTSLLFLSATSEAAPVYLDTATNLEWRQVADTVGYSYNQMNTGGINGCSALTGQCSGQLGGSGPSLNGWMWATEEQVRTLFHDFSGSMYIPAFDPLPSVPYLEREYNSLWAQAIIDTDGVWADDGIFDATKLPSLSDFDSQLKGYARTIDPYDATFAYMPIISIDYNYDNLGDVAATNSFANVSTSSSTRGFWLYRDATPEAVPEPAIMLLISLGLAGLVGAKRTMKH